MKKKWLVVILLAFLFSSCTFIMGLSIEQRIVDEIIDRAVEVEEANVWHLGEFKGSIIYFSIDISGDSFYHIRFDDVNSSSDVYTVNVDMRFYDENFSLLDTYQEGFDAAIAIPSDTRYILFINNEGETGEFAYKIW